MNCFDLIWRLEALARFGSSISADDATTKELMDAIETEEPTNKFSRKKVRKARSKTLPI